MALVSDSETPQIERGDVASLLADERDLYVASRALKAMGHPLRLKILCILAGAQEISVQDLVEMVGTSQSNISQHLSIMRDKGILGSRKDANKVFYRIGDEKILQLIGPMREAFCPPSICPAPCNRSTQPLARPSTRLLYTSAPFNQYFQPWTLNSSLQTGIYLPRLPSSAA